jgi:CobQ/CobB/MinD/ParA nucleotide binding domain
MTNNKARVITILGGKGGVGKTLLASTLADFYQEKDVKHLAIDADTENSKHGSLAHLIGCKKLDIASKLGLDALIDHALGGPEIVLVDFGAGTISELAQWIGGVGEALAKENISLTIVALITEELATVEGILRCAEKVADKASYVLVENRGKGAEPATFTNASLREFVEVAKPAHVILEALRPDIANELDRVGQSPRAAQREPKSDLLKTGSARIRLTAWREDLDKQFLRTDALLPL